MSNGLTHISTEQKVKINELASRKSKELDMNPKEDAFLYLGHGLDDLNTYHNDDKKIQVPKGCMLVVKIHSGDVAYAREYYKNISNLIKKENRNIILNPNANRDSLYKLFTDKGNNTVAIYNEFDKCNNFKYYLILSFFINFTLCNSGIIHINSTNNISNNITRECYKYSWTGAFNKAFTNRNGIFTLNKFQGKDIWYYYKYSNAYEYYFTENHIKDLLEAITSFINLKINLDSNVKESEFIIEKNKIINDFGIFISKLFRPNELRHRITKEKIKKSEPSEKDEYTYINKTAKHYKNYKYYKEENTYTEGSLIFSKFSGEDVFFTFTEKLKSAMFTSDDYTKVQKKHVETLKDKIKTSTIQDIINIIAEFTIITQKEIFEDVESGLIKPGIFYNLSCKGTQNTDASAPVPLFTRGENSFKVRLDPNGNEVYWDLLFPGEGEEKKNRIIEAEGHRKLQVRNVKNTLKAKRYHPLNVLHLFQPEIAESSNAHKEYLKESEKSNSNFLYKKNNSGKWQRYKKGATSNLNTINTPETVAENQGLIKTTTNERNYVMNKNGKWKTRKWNNVEKKYVVNNTRKNPKFTEMVEKGNAIREEKNKYKQEMKELKESLGIE